MRQYYAHPQNAFWRIMAQLLGKELPLPYAQRARMLTDRRIALWDVLAAARRPGSLDSSIEPATLQSNDFVQFFSAHPQVRRVFFNGRKAEELFRRHVLPTLGANFSAIQYDWLPSTSPAHAGMPYATKLAKWRLVMR